MTIRPASLGRWPVGWVALACVVTVIPVRVWTIIFMPPIQAYALFPAWAQAAVLAAYAGQLAAETWGTLRVRAAAAALCTTACALSAGAFVAADWQAPQWVHWAGQAVIELAVLWRLAIEIGGHSVRGIGR